ncbi:MAG: copper amine oxidase N-terminal domain-containing protein, partial [bacterium]|nr:copper amine oxidase N-terminal domain-containing protein [bacterium]
MFRKLIALVVVAMLVAGMGGSPAQAMQEIRIRVNGVFLNLDVLPIIENGRTLVPARFPSEALGAGVEWGSEGIVVISLRGKVVVLSINETTAHVDGLSVALDVPPRIVDGRTLIPLRFFAEALDQSVYWDGDKRIVDIVSKG